MKSTSLLASAFAVMALGIALAAPAALVVEPFIGKYATYEVDDFTILTSRSGDQGSHLIEGLAKIRVALEKTLGKRTKDSAVPTRIVIVSNTVWNRYLAPRQGVAGWFHAGRFGNTMALDGDAVLGAALYVMFHEYTHFYLSSEFAGEYPPWFNEGMAELMALTKFNKDSATMQVPQFRVLGTNDGEWIPFERLIQVDRGSPEYQTHRLANSFYSQAWLTVHYGMVENREFGRQMFGYLAELNNLRPQTDAARLAFGPDLDAIDKQLRDYSRTNKKASGRIVLGELPVVTMPTGQPVPTVDASAALIEIMLDSQFSPDRIRPLLEMQARNETDSARPAIFAAQLALAEGKDALYAQMVAEAQRRLKPADFGLRRDLANVLLDGEQNTASTSKRTAEDSSRDLKLALRLFGEAIAHDSTDVEALWGFGTAALRLDRNLDLAEQALLAAYERNPVSATIAMSLAELKSRQQQHAATIPYLKDAVRYANDLQTRKWATERLAEMEKWVAEQEKYESELAEYEKKHGKPKKKSGS